MYSCHFLSQHSTGCFSFCFQSLYDQRRSCQYHCERGEGVELLNQSRYKGKDFPLPIIEPRFLECSAVRNNQTQHHAFLTLAFCRGDRSVSSTSRFISICITPGTHWTEDWMRSRTSLDRMSRSLPRLKPQDL